MAKLGQTLIIAQHILLNLLSSTFSPGMFINGVCILSKVYNFYLLKIFVHYAPVLGQQQNIFCSDLLILQLKFSATLSQHS